MPIGADDNRLGSAYTPAGDRYDHSHYRRAGHSGILLPRISLGLWQNFGSDRSPDRQRSIILHAFDRGVVHFDLANNYGPPYGQAERTFGSVLRTDLRSHRDELFIATKAGYDMWPGPYGEGGSRKYMLRSLEQSLRRMGTDYVDIFYSHRPDPDTPLEETVGALVSAVESGKAMYVGLSNYSAESTVQATKLLAARGISLLLHQPRYSLFDRRPESDLFAELTTLGVGAAIFSPLAQGLLTEKYIAGAVPADSRAAGSRFLKSSAITADYLRRIRGISAIANDSDLSIPTLALAWALRNPVVCAAVVGASSSDQLDQALAAANVELTESQLSALEEFAAPSGEAVR